MTDNTYYVIYTAQLRCQGYFSEPIKNVFGWWFGTDKFAAAVEIVGSGQIVTICAITFSDRDDEGAEQRVLQEFVIISVAHNIFYMMAREINKENKSLNSLVTWQNQQYIPRKIEI